VREVSARSETMHAELHLTFKGERRPFANSVALLLANRKCTPLAHSWRPQTPSRRPGKTQCSTQPSNALSEVTLPAPDRLMFDQRVVLARRVTGPRGE
jgi:hypothetical protein